MRKSQEPVGWGQLPTMWGKIFFWLKYDDDAGIDGLLCDESQTRWEEFYLLRSVCTKFKAVFAQHPEFYSGLRMSNAVRAENLPSLFQWVKQHWSSVRVISAVCGTPCLEAALAALGLYQSHDKLLGVTTVYILDVPLSTPSLLAQFASITKICFDMDSYICGQRQEIDVQPLCTLPHLRHLAVMDGSVYNLNAAAHLTSLEPVKQLVLGTAIVYHHW